MIVVFNSTNKIVGFYCTYHGGGAEGGMGGDCVVSDGDDGALKEDWWLVEFN